MKLPTLDPNTPHDDRARRAIALMTQGGDARIILDPVSGLNRYHSAPYPRAVLAYASSTANDLSADAFAHVLSILDDDADYGAALDSIRARIRAAYALPADTGIVIAPSGTDLEYVGLAAARGRAPNGILNVLLGADEVGSGCIHSAHGRYFAGETALGVATTAGAPVPGLGDVDLIDIPVRDAEGRPQRSDVIREAIATAVTRAVRKGRHAVVHVVHGSKTGLVLPALDDLDALIATHGDAISVVVDACQARITTPAIAAYLARGAIVFLTGSKFMGGPPFSGFALVPAGIPTPTLPKGYADIFARAEWPAAWPGRETLADAANPGLRLRLSASIFELERFQALPIETVERVILAFHAAVREAFVDHLGGRRLAPYAPGLKEEADTHPIEMRTLSTIDISTLPGAPDFDTAQALHKRLALEGIRLGQPVKCLPLANGGWGGTLRVGLSMPQVVALAALPDEALSATLAAQMTQIADTIAAG